MLIQLSCQGARQKRHRDGRIYVSHENKSTKGADVKSEEERTDCHEQTWQSFAAQVIYRLVCKLDGWMAMTVLLALIFAFLIAFIVVRLS